MRDIIVNTDQFFRKMLEFLPSTKGEYENSIDYYGERLETVIIEDIFFPKIIEMLRTNENTELLYKIFDYFEEVSNCKDQQLIDDFSVTVLEVLGNDKGVLLIAQEYMGPMTKLLQVEADRGLGRI